MPTYGYKCLDCGEDFDVKATVAEKIANDPKIFVCSECGSKNVKQEFSLAALISKSGNQSGGCDPGCGCC